MHVVELQVAEAHLAQLVEEAAAGDQIIIACAGKPVAMLSRYGESEKPRAGAMGIPVWPGTISGSLSRQQIYDVQDG